ncbi:hypothetical protein NKG05_25855 [Oerskovia sp. M15]
MLPADRPRGAGTPGMQHLQQVGEHPNLLVGVRDQVVEVFRVLEVEAEVSPQCPQRLPAARLPGDGTAEQLDLQQGAQG